MQKVWIDARMVGPQAHGIGVYVTDLAAGLAADNALSFSPHYLLSPRCPADSLLRQLPHAECPVPFLHWQEPWTLGRQLSQLKPDLYVSPSFASLRKYPCPHAQIVHDLNHLQFGSLPHKIYYRHLLLPSLRTARAVASITNFAAEELAQWLGEQGAARPVSVVPNAIRALPRAEAALLARWQLRAGEYFFCLSNDKPHKNLPLLRTAYAAAGEHLPPLVLSVNDPSPPKGVVATGPLAPAEVATLLTHARAFFFPSLYEGLGRPPLEAALAGTPAVCANIPPLREALAGVRETVFLDPRDPNAWTEAFRRASVRPKTAVSAASIEWVERTHGPRAQAEAARKFITQALRT